MTLQDRVFLSLCLPYAFLQGELYFLWISFLSPACPRSPVSAYPTPLLLLMQNDRPFHLILSGLLGGIGPLWLVPTEKSLLLWPPPNVTPPRACWLLLRLLCKPLCLCCAHNLLSPTHGHLLDCGPAPPLSPLQSPLWVISGFLSSCVSGSVMSILCHPIDCSLPRSSVHGILQARILEWLAFPISRGFSWPRDLPHCKHILYCVSHQESPQSSI